nr:MAG TPA: hypothetical protein [Caudoviricetes sp.]
MIPPRSRSRRTDGLKSASLAHSANSSTVTAPQL